MLIFAHYICRGQRLYSYCQAAGATQHTLLYLMKCQTTTELTLSEALGPLLSTVSLAKHSTVVHRKLYCSSSSGVDAGVQGCSVCCAELAHESEVE
jgi:hypothetical protein